MALVAANKRIIQSRAFQTGIETTSLNDKYATKMVDITYNNIPPNAAFVRHSSSKSFLVSCIISFTNFRVVSRILQI